MDLFYWQEETPIGLLTVITEGQRCCRIAFATEPWQDIQLWLKRVFSKPRLQENYDAAAPIVQQLHQYLDHNLHKFSFPLTLRGTPFQRKVWQELLKIPYGKTVSYGALAQKIASSSRAVGGAVGANPVAIAVPCHRVIGADGSLIGFGGGLPTKLKLLETENIIPRAGETIESWLKRHPQKPRFLGNRSRKTFCRSGCPQLGQLDLRQYIPALFVEAEEARAAGYRPCPHCLGSK
ncbi:MAG: methylated-DNA--[protein]-cysteine S-methyltransferase [Firmicutes bacterium]|nr:methylated-DNA--[protein]-cysteine S-methyltransferase [Bacillota bacterium]